MFVKQCSIHGSRAKYIYGRKKQINYKFIPTSLFRGRPLIRGFNENKLINHLQSRILHCNTFTARATTRQSPQRTFLPASTNGCHPYHLIKHPLTKQHLLTRKHSMKVDTTTPCSTNQPKQANVKTDSATTSSGTTPRLAKTPVQTSDTNSSP